MMSQTNISFQDFLEVSTWCQLLGSRNIIKMCAVTCFYPSALKGWLAVFITQRAGGQAAWTPTGCEGNNSRMRQRSILKLTPEVYLLKMWISITSSSRSKSQFSENLVNALTPAWGDIFQIATAAMTKGLKTPVIRNKRVFKTGKRFSYVPPLYCQLIISKRDPFKTDVNFALTPDLQWTKARGTGVGGGGVHTRPCHYYVCPTTYIIITCTHDLGYEPEALWIQC